MNPSNTDKGYTDLIALGFATTTAMWGAVYVLRLPSIVAPSWMVMGVMLLCLFGGGYCTAQYARRDIRGGALVGLFSSLLNLMILGSLIMGEKPNEIRPAALLWIPGSLLGGAVLAALGASMGAKGYHDDTQPEPDWLNVFAWVVAAATFILLVAGGMVTSADAGLAVVDWPRSYGYNMILYPLSKMTGGIYLEHTHRLLGSLVGFATLVLAYLIFRNDHRTWLKQCMVLAVVFVIVQGVLGGLRVTGHFTLSTSPEDVAPSLLLAFIHGVLGQVFFSMMVAIAVFTSRLWKSDTPPQVMRSASTDRTLSLLLTATLVVQLVFGAVQRHFIQGLLIHISMAIVVIAVVVFCGIRAWGVHTENPTLQGLGKTLIVFSGIQLVLGFAALFATQEDARKVGTSMIKAMFATAHQAVGGLMLALAVMLLLWSYRLVQPETTSKSA